MIRRTILLAGIAAAALSAGPAAGDDMFSVRDIRERLRPAIDDGVLPRPVWRATPIGPTADPVPEPTPPAPGVQLAPSPPGTLADQRNSGEIRAEAPPKPGSGTGGR
jgi:hypothetical protein